MRPPSLPFRAASIFAVLVLCAVACVSQAAQEREAPPTGLALETDAKDGVVGHVSVPGRFFGGRYRPLPDWRPPADSQPQPRTFKLMNWPEGDGVRVKFFAVWGRFHEEEVLLADHLLREGEKAAFESMRTYGYVPMEVTVVRVKRAPTSLPVATSAAQSVVVVGVEERPQANFPSYKITLRNISDRDITQLEVHAFRGGRRTTVQWPRAEQNGSLLKAGGVYELSVTGGGRGQRSPEGYTPSAPDSVEVISAVFADESYEGERKSAVTYLLSLRGQRMQLARALALLGSAAQGADGRPALDDFEGRVRALDRQAPAAVEDLPAAIPGLTQREYEGMRASVEGGLDQVRRELLKDVQEYRQAHERSPGSRPYAAWLVELRKKYEAWLSRL